MTSCRVSRSMASMRSMSAGPIAASLAPPRSRMVRAAVSGMVPWAAIASAASASISNQMRKRFSGDQIAAISGLA